MRKAYTGKGDEGITSDYAGKKLDKHSFEVKLVGKIDSLQSSIDLAILKADVKVREILEEVQKKLWQTSGELFNCPSDCVLWPVKEEDLKKVENFIEYLGEPPNKFVRFNTMESIILNECRVRCREVETNLSELLSKGKVRRIVFKYINRLSSLFFMLSYNKSINSDK
jgi:cob(I)alamin adenosyltransferase